jgi:hypothetical protein
MTETTPEPALRWCAGCREALSSTAFQKTSRRCRDCVRIQTRRRRAIDYDAELASQDGVCAICKKPPVRRGPRERLALDHDHKTGYFRGLICDPCNLMLGLVDDDPVRLLTAIEYLKRPGRPLDLPPLKCRNAPRYPVTVTYRAPAPPSPVFLAPRFLSPRAG